MGTTVLTHRVYLLVDQRAGPCVVGIGGTLAEVMQEVEGARFKRTCATGNLDLFPFCLVWLERMETQSETKPHRFCCNATRKPNASPNKT